MKFFILLLCITLSVALVPAPQPSAPIANHPAYPPVNVAPVPPQPTLGQELRELKLLFPKKELGYLIRRYLLNDAEFQGVIRTLNSFEAYMAGISFLRQPEVVAVRAQLRLANLGSEEDLFSSEELELFNKSPYWANSVYGWQGFINEFLMIYPEYTFQQIIQTKLQQNTELGKFWRQVQGLRLAFDRFLALPGTQNVIMLLQEHGVDTIQLESLIRTQFGWVPPPPAAVASPAAAPAPVVA